MKNNYPTVMIRTFTFCGLVILFACSTEKNSSDKKNNYAAGPSAIIYKTKNNYYDKIPVTLNEGKTKIISYPGTRDIFYKGELAYPSKLSEGYLLDNRGINKNTAFLKITYEEYSKKADASSSSEMMNMILDKEPFLEIYDCGSRYQYKNAVAELNAAINNKELNKFKKIL